MNYLSFARALRDPSWPCPEGLHVHNGSDPAARFAVYRNNVVTSLVGALSDAFPVVRQLVGDEFFAAMARVHAVRQPPCTPVLSDWGDTFAEFIADFEPAASVPYLADVARLERARLRAYHAADAASLDAGEIALHLSDDPAKLAGARLMFHPSVQIVGSDFAIVSLWAAHQGHGDIAQVDPLTPEAAIVLREDDDAAVIRLPAFAELFLRRLMRGDTLARSSSEACVAARVAGKPFELAASLAILVRHGALTAWRTPLEHCE